MRRRLNIRAILSDPRLCEELLVGAGLFILGIEGLDSPESRKNLIRAYRTIEATRKK